MFHFHSWSKWSEPIRPIIKTTTDYKDFSCDRQWHEHRVVEEQSVEVTQTRFCETCNLIQTRTVK